jgi:hypothetical protein
MLLRPSFRRHSLAAAGIALCLGVTGVTPASASAHHALSKAQVDRIVKFSGYHSLQSHRFDVAGQFSAGAARFKVVRLDGARLDVPLSEVRRDVLLAESVAQAGGTFTSKIKVGRGHKQRITYHVAPSAPSGRSNTRYIIFTPRSERLDSLTAPQRVPQIQAFTLVRGAGRLTVTLLHDRAPGATWQQTQIPFANLCALIESFNATNRITVSPATLRRLARHHVDLSYLTDINHPNPSRHRELANLAGRGYEIWSNSVGFAVTSAQAGVSYRHYVRRLVRMGFAFYRKNHMHYLKVSPASYHNFAHSG